MSLSLEDNILLLNTSFKYPVRSDIYSILGAALVKFRNKRIDKFVRRT